MAGQRIQFASRPLTTGSSTNRPATSRIPSNAPAPSSPVPSVGRAWERFTVLRSPQPQAKITGDVRATDAQRLIDIIEPTHKTVDELKKLNLPAGVDITIKI
jgi:small subunit ribosomal protein S10